MNEAKIAKNRADHEDNTEPFNYPPELSAGYGIRNAHRLLVRDLEEAVGFVGVSRGQWYFLRALWVEDGLTQRELSARVAMKEPTTVLALKGMEKSKLIYRVRDEVDLRKVRVYLTDAGHGLRDILLPMIKVIVDRATAGIPPRDLSTFQKVLNQIIEKLRATEDLEPLVWEPLPSNPAPCWKLLATNSNQYVAPSKGVSGQSGLSRSQELRNFKACAVCYARARGNPRCPPRAG